MRIVDRKILREARNTMILLTFLLFFRQYVILSKTLFGKEGGIIMVMKASFICLLLIVYMGCFYYTKHLPIKSTRIFSYCYISMIVLMVFDLITLYTVNHLASVPDLINLSVHATYLISINVTVYLYFLYLRSLLENEILIPGVLRKIQSAPFIITSFLIAILPLGYVTGTYSNYV